MKKTEIVLLTLLLMLACENLFGPDNPVTAGFTYTVGIETNYDVVFTNTSENATDYYWDFGDTTYSEEKNPTHYYNRDGEYIVSLRAMNDDHSNTFKKNILVNWASVDKPNIYLYPEDDIDIEVYLNFPNDGHVTKSIPEYGTGWSVHVNSQGIIDNTYEYLFYEAVQPLVWQSESGWCIARNSLADFFNTNMTDYGFNEKEIADFVEYWVPRLTDSDYYLIYPQTNDVIDQVIELDFSIQPQNVNRLIYWIKETDHPIDLETPEINTVNRNGFTVVEWGVTLEKD